MEVYKAESLFTDVSLRKEDMHVFRQTVYSCPKCNFAFFFFFTIRNNVICYE